MQEEADNIKRNFHEFAMNSGLFKGRQDLYFSYLKSERLAHALSTLYRAADFGHRDVFESLLRSATIFPGALARFAAGEIEESGLLADLFEILSLVRLSVSQELLAEHNAKILVEEYENIGHKIDMGKNASPFIALEDIAVPSLRIEQSSQNKPGRSLPPPKMSDRNLKDNRSRSRTEGRGTNGRAHLILDFIRKHKRVSIKEIAAVVKGCSEKTIQRELTALVGQGLVRKEGERRWSVYLPS